MSDDLPRSLRTRLQSFLIRNPEADVREDDDDFAIIRAWGEEAIELALDPPNDELIEALNYLKLPPRFTAIWHDDVKALEVIFTPFSVDEDLEDRNFTFHYRKKEYECSFGPSSERLRIVAKAFTPRGPSSSDHRNLAYFSFYEHFLEVHSGTTDPPSSGPLSFWIRGVEEYDDTFLVEFVRCLNFYLIYFDKETPQILIHEEPAKPIGKLRPERYPTGSFPPVVTSMDIDQHLLSLWESACKGDTFLRFIHYYQILEYAAFYYIREDVMQTIKRVITAPDSVAQPQVAARKILDAMVAERTQDESKINDIVRRCVDPTELWAELGDRQAFCSEVTLDGGFVLPAIVDNNADVDAFVQSWHQRFPAALHRIRNALVHAREARQSTMIAPTRSNHDRLFLWLSPLSYTASRVMLYSEL